MQRPGTLWFPVRNRWNLHPSLSPSSLSANAAQVRRLSGEGGWCLECGGSVPGLLADGMSLQ